MALPALPLQEWGDSPSACRALALLNSLWEADYKVATVWENKSERSIEGNCVFCS
jgi:hypothetical protein